MARVVRCAIPFLLGGVLLHAEHFGYVRSGKRPIPGSSVVWSGQREPVSAAIGAGENQRLLASHPLVSEGQILVPSITRTLSKKQNLYVYFEIYDPAHKPDTKLPLVVASVSFYRRGLKAFESSPVQLTTLSKDRAGTLPVQFQVPLGKLQPGRYTCQVNVIDEAAKKFEFLRAPLVVLS